MSVVFSEPEVVERLRSKKLLHLLMVANLAFAAAILLFWTTTAVFLEAPLSWGTSASIERDHTIKSFFSYPYILLWGMPTTAVLFANMAQRNGRYKVANLIVLVPLMIFALVFAIYHFAPIDWR
jgi:hypothetical protein